MVCFQKAIAKFIIYSNAVPVIHADELVACLDKI